MSYAICATTWEPGLSWGIPDVVGKLWDSKADAMAELASMAVELDAEIDAGDWWFVAPPDPWNCITRYWVVEWSGYRG